MIRILLASGFFLFGSGSASSSPICFYCKIRILQKRKSGFFKIGNRTNLSIIHPYLHLKFTHNEIHKKVHNKSHNKILNEKVHHSRYKVHHS